MSRFLERNLRALLWSTAVLVATALVVWRWQVQERLNAVSHPALGPLTVAPASWRSEFAAGEGAPVVARDFQLFIPPPLEHDPGSGRIRVRRPPVSLARSSPEPDLRIVRLRREAFRVELVGYIGEGDHVRGLFVVAPEGVIFTAGHGREVPEHELRIGHVSLRRDPASGVSVMEAEVEDLQTGERVRLRSDRGMTENLLRAEMMVEPGQPIRTVWPGAEFEARSARYRIEEIGVGGVRLSRQRGDGVTDSLWLVAPPAEGGW